MRPKKSPMGASMEGEDSPSHQARRTRFLRCMLVIGVDGEPDVGDDAGAFHVEKGERCAGIDRAEVGVAAGACPNWKSGGICSRAGEPWRRAHRAPEAVWRGPRLGGFFLVAADAVGVEAEEGAGGGEGADHFAAGWCGGGQMSFGGIFDGRRAPILGDSERCSAKTLQYSRGWCECQEQNNRLPYCSNGCTGNWRMLSTRYSLGMADLVQRTLMACEWLR